MLENERIRENGQTSNIYQNELNFSQDLLDYGTPNGYTVRITKIYLYGLVLSIVFYLLDVGTDIYLAYQYYHCNETYHCTLTVFFFVFPASINTMLSIKMYASYKESVSSRKWFLRGCGLTLQFAPLIRYIEALQYALKLKKEDRSNSSEFDKYSKFLLREDSNLALLRIIEAFLEAAPQQVLQIAILLRNLRLRNINNNLLQVYQYMSISTSLISIAWSFAIYNRSIRFAREDKRKLTWTGSIVQVSWFFFVTSSRILAISEIASLFPFPTFSVCAAHWLLMTIWISIFDRTWFCRRSEASSQSRLKNYMEFSFCAVLGLVYIFAFLPTNDGDTRYKYIFYYSIYFIENTTAVLLWNVMENAEVKRLWLFTPLLVVTFLMFLFGVVLMLLYYWYFHPERGLIPKLRQTQEPRSKPTHESNVSDHYSTEVVQTDE